MTPDATPAAELLRATVGRVGLATAADGELVRRFADHRDDLAFAELIHRFAPAVYALCRRHLTDPGTIDDAFQAVFVLLARKAGGLTHPDRVGGWLAGAADRIARTARRRQARRGERHRPLESVPEPAVVDPSPSDLRTVLDDELAKLPPHYREVVLLCDLDGVARRAAAAKLGIPVTTLGNRLTRARAVLGRRLLRRGVLVAAGGVLTGGSLAHPPPRLLASAVRSALADAPPPELLSLLTPVVPAMVRAKQLLAVVAGLAMLGGAITGVVVLMQPPPAPPTSEGEQAKPTEPRKQETPTTRVANNALAKGLKPLPAVVRDHSGGHAFSPNGKWMARTTFELPADGGGWTAAKIEVLDAASGEAKASLDLLPIQKAEKLFLLPDTLAVTDDGKRVFAAGWVGGLRVWDTTKSGFEEKRLAHDKEEHVRHCKLSPDGKQVVALLTDRAEKHMLGVWDADSGERVRTFSFPRVVWGEFTFPDGGKTLAGVTLEREGDKVLAAVREVDAATGEEKRRIDLGPQFEPTRGEVRCWRAAYTADGKQVVVAGGYWMPQKADDDPTREEYGYRGSGSVWVIDRESGKLVKTLIDRRNDVIRSVHRTADGKKMIVQPALPSRLDRDFGGPTREDAEFVELQQWDVATWERDWVKIVPAAERWKLLGGAK